MHFDALGPQRGDDIAFPNVATRDDVTRTVQCARKCAHSRTADTDDVQTPPRLQRRCRSTGCGERW